MSVRNDEEQYDLENNYFPRDLSYSNEKKEIYERLQNGDNSPLKNKTFAEIFIYAVIYGYKNKENIPLTKAIPQIPSNAFSKINKSLLLAIMISQSPKGIEVLVDKMEVKKELEQYANGGISILESVLTSGRIGDAVTQLEKEIRKLLFDPKKEAQEQRSEKKEEIERVGPAMQAIATFESGLREIIPIILGKISTDWKDNLPDKKMIPEWEKVLNQNEERFKIFGKENMSILHGAYLGDLKSIVVNRNNYEPYFKEIFGDKQQFLHDCNRTVLIRNDPAHSYGLSESEFNILISTLQLRNEQLSKALTKIHNQE
jgi:hypothetical protein